ncbi:MAG: DNA gyrase inhibitor YacG [Burkholderiaceae bacterium]
MLVKAARVIRCPGCGGPSVYGLENPSRPFCSPRCKNNDFGAWATENYRVEAQPEPGDEDEPPSAIRPVPPIQ